MTKKQRVETIEFTAFAGDDGRLEFSYDFENDHLKIDPSLKADTEFVHVRSYERSKGRKVISRVPMDPDRLAFSQFGSLDSNFERIIAIDTNTKTIEKRKVSISGVYEAFKAWVDSGKGYEQVWLWSGLFCFEFVELDKPEENHAWLHVLSHLINTAYISESESLGLCVDSDLGMLPDYNSRQRPFVRSKFLPPKWKFIYASGERDTDKLANLLIKNCDAMAAQCFKIVEEKGVCTGATGGRLPYCACARILFPKNSPLLSQWR